VIEIQDNLNNEEVRTINIDMCSRNIVAPDLTIHSLFVYAEADLKQVMQREVIICMETLDN